MKIKKIIFLLLLIGIGGFIITNYSFAKTDAAKTDAEHMNTLMSGMSGVNNVTNTGEQTKKVLNAIIKIIQVVGSGISLIVITMTGIKYMTASANDKADLKKQMVPILIGCVLLFAGSNFAGIIASVGNKLN